MNVYETFLETRIQIGNTTFLTVNELKYVHLVNFWNL